MQGFSQSPSDGGDRSIEQLRAMVARMDGSLVQRRSNGSVLAFGVAAIDAHLPLGGLGPGLHEMASAASDGGFASAPARLAAHLFGMVGGDGAVLWVTERRDLHAPGLAGSGLAPGRLLVARAGRDVLAVIEEGARSSGLVGVVGEIGGALSLTASRRILLAAERSGVPVIAIRRPWRLGMPGEASAVDAPNAAITRWRVAALPSRPADPIEAGPFTLTVDAALWRLDLVRARGAAPSSWIVEAFDASGRLAVPAVPSDRSAPVGRRRRSDDAAGHRAA